MPLGWRKVCEVLELKPDHISANVLAGELWLLHWEEIGFADHSAAMAAENALPYFERALARAPRQPEAWRGKAEVWMRRGDAKAAVEASQQGLAALPTCAGVYARDPETYRYIAEEVYATAVKALLADGRRKDAWQLLSQAINEIPNSNYLAECLLPEFNGND